MTYRVLDNGKPANRHLFPNVRFYGSDWDTSDFSTWEEALKYARQWCTPYGGSFDGEEGFILTPEEPEYDYSGYGDTVSISEVS